MNIAENLKNLKNELPEHVKLVAVTKTKPVEDIMEAYNAGHKIFGENKVQELTSKYDKLPEDIEWHMIGHLQSNKTKYIAPFVTMIHSLDSLKLMKFINKEAQKNKRTIDCLFQIHIAKEEQKFGFDPDELLEILESGKHRDFENIRYRGVMGMATFTSDENIIRNEFRSLKNFFNQIKNDFFSADQDFYEISMGMSGDYRIAVEQGSSIVRIGSLIFGERN